MKKLIIACAFILVFASLSYAWADLSNLSNQNCEESTGIWRCHIPAELSDVSGKLTGDIACFSTMADSIDKGCFTSVEIQKTAYVRDCTYSVSDAGEIVYNECENVSLDKGELLLLVISPDNLDLSGCDTFQESGIYVNDCALNGKDILFSGSMNLADSENPIVLTSKIKISGFDLLAFLLNNLLYIVLIIVIIALAYWVFAPHKPMLRERKEGKKPPAKTTVTRRERRYGRKL